MLYVLHHQNITFLSFLFKDFTTFPETATFSLNFRIFSTIFSSFSGPIYFLNINLFLTFLNLYLNFYNIYLLLNKTVSFSLKIIIISFSQDITKKETRLLLKFLWVTFINLPLGGTKVRNPSVLHVRNINLVKSMFLLLTAFC